MPERALSAVGGSVEDTSPRPRRRLDKTRPAVRYRSLPDWSFAPIVALSRNRREAAAVAADIPPDGGIL